MRIVCAGGGSLDVLTIIPLVKRRGRRGDGGSLLLLSQFSLVVSRFSSCFILSTHKTHERKEGLSWNKSQNASKITKQKGLEEFWGGWGGRLGKKKGVGCLALFFINRRLHFVTTYTYTSTCPH